MSNILTLAEQQSPLHNLIIRYGKLVEVKIRAAKSRDRAARFVEDTCRAFDLPVLYNEADITKSLVNVTIQTASINAGNQKTG